MNDYLKIYMNKQEIGIIIVKVFSNNTLYDTFEFEKAISLFRFIKKYQDKKYDIYFV